MKVATVIVAWNGAQHLTACLESVPSDCDIVVVDNASTDSTAAIAREHAARRSLELLSAGENLGFTRGANLGLRHLLERQQHELILLLNQDAQLRPDCISALGELAARSPKAGAIGAKILYPDGQTLQHAGGRLELPRLIGVHQGHHSDDHRRYPTTDDVDFVTGAVMMLRAEALREVGVFNEIFSPGYYEDVELCDRLRAAGWSVFYCAEAVALHVESASFRDPFQRQLLHHRNRLFYALPALCDSGFARSFCQAEQASFEGENDVDLLRATAAAYLEALLRLDEAARSRLPPRLRNRDSLLPLVAMLSGLRDHCLEQIRQRRTTF
jgi:GT2 family glycosyltransferase